jgi:hypothetical protein
MNAADHRLRMLAGALVARLTLEGRDADAEALVRDFAQRRFKAPERGVVGDAARELGRTHDTRMLAATLVEHLALNGRADDARQLDRLFREMGLTAQRSANSGGA